MTSRHLRAVCRQILLVAAVIGLAGSSQAADQIWSGASNASWATAGNWSGGVPTGSDNAFFNDSNAANKSVVLPGSATANQLTTTVAGFGLSTGTLTLADQLYLYGTSASLTLSGGSRVATPNSSIGVGAGDGGNTLTVGSALAVTNTLNVGYGGTANALQVSSGGDVIVGALNVGVEADAAANSVAVAAGRARSSRSSRARPIW